MKMFRHIINWLVMLFAGNRDCFYICQHQWLLYRRKSDLYTLAATLNTLYLYFAGNRSCCYAPVAQVDPSMEEEEDQKLKLYQEEILHAKVCHIYWQSTESTKVHNKQQLK